MLDPTTILLLIVLLTILASAQRAAQPVRKISLFHQLKGSQRVFGMAAFMAAILIVLTPEFAALGLIGDAALFDALVVVLTVQLHTYFTQAWRGLGRVARQIALIAIPRNRMSHMYIALALEGPRTFLASVHTRLLHRRGSAALTQSC
jgi:hypothetical protein